MFRIEYAIDADISIWLTYDQHISEKELRRKIADKRCYMLRNDSVPIGVMRYNLLFDTIPFLTLIYFDEAARRNGFGTQAMRHWEAEMRAFGYPCVMTSTQADESAQFFYRKLGYQDTGCLILTVPSLAQPAEIFMIKEL